MRKLHGTLYNKAKTIQKLTEAPFLHGSCQLECGLKLQFLQLACALLSACHTCKRNNPCTVNNSGRDHDCPGHAHCNQRKFIVCDKFIGCLEKRCASGKLWDQANHTCV